MKKLTSILLALLMALTLLPTAVFATETVKEWTATDSLPEYGTYKLMRDVTLSTSRAKVGNNHELTLDLNGHTITATTKSAFQVYKGKLTLTNSRPNQGGISFSSSDDSQIAAIVVFGDYSANHNSPISSSLIIDSGVSITSTNRICVWIVGKGATADISGKLTANGEYAAIQGNGSIGGSVNYSETEITINDGAEITSQSNCAIYHPQKGTLTVNGGTISGGTGIEMRAGTLDVKGGTIKATGDYTAPVANDNGSTTKGSAIVVAEHTTNLGVTVNVTGGNIVAASGAKAVVVADPQSKGTDDVKVTLNGANVTGEIFKETNVSAETNPIAVSGGAYTDLANAMKYATSGTTIKLASNISGMCGVSVPTGKNLTVDFDGHTVTMNKPGAGSENTETQGFQLLKGSTIVFKNGTINIDKDNLTPVTDTSKGGNIKFIIQNYADLTLDNMVLDGKNLNPQSNMGNYTLSNNNGTVLIKDTTITAREGDRSWAFDVCRYSSYTGPNVTVEGKSVINGKVEISSSGAKEDAVHKLTVNGGTFNGAIVETGTNPNFVGVVTGGTFATNPKDYVAENYAVTKKTANGATTYTVGMKLADYTAVNAALEKAAKYNEADYTTDSYAKLTAAVDAVVTGKTIDEQAAVTKMATDIEAAIEGLVKRVTTSTDNKKNETSSTVNESTTTTTTSGTGENATTTVTHTIDATTGSNNETTTAIVNVPTDVVATMANSAADADNVTVVIKTDVGTITLDKKALEAITTNLNSVEGTVTELRMTVKDTTDDDNSNHTKRYEVTIEAVDEDGNTTSVYSSSNSKGSATVTVDYIQQNANKRVYVYYVENGVTKERMNATYVDGKLTWTTTHFSTFEVREAYPPRIIHHGGAASSTTTTDKSTSPTTFDAGIAIYGVMAVSSVLGMGYMGKKKFF